MLTSNSRRRNGDVSDDFARDNKLYSELLLQVMENLLDEGYARETERWRSLARALRHVAGSD